MHNVSIYHAFLRCRYINGEFYLLAAQVSPPEFESIPLDVTFGMELFDLKTSCFFADFN